MPSYLSISSDRFFRVCVDGPTSTVGYVPSPPVTRSSVLYTTNLPVLSGVTLSLYVDDALYHYTSANVHFTSSVSSQC